MQRNVTKKSTDGEEWSEQARLAGGAGNWLVTRSYLNHRIGLCRPRQELQLRSGGQVVGLWVGRHWVGLHRRQEGGVQQAPPV